MVITLGFPPGQTPVIGPGGWITVSSNVVDQPKPLPDFWDVDVVTLEGALSLWHNRVAGDGFGRVSWQIGNPIDQPVHNQERKPVWPTNQSVLLNVRWINQAENDHDTPLQVQLPWNATDAVWQLPTNVSGGFSTTDREVLLSTNAAVISSFAVSDSPNAVRNIPIGELLPGPPANVLIKTAPILISGSGSLLRPAGGPAVNAYGATWSWFTVPQFFGRKPGAAIEYEARMLQVVVVREDAGSDLYMAQLQDSSVEGSYYLWGVPIPSRIDYNVAPGVEVAWQWLILPIGQ